MRFVINTVMTLMCLIMSVITVNGAKTVKIRLTGTINENILMHVGTTGRTEVISDLPYTFEVPKNQMPIRLKFQSENFLYYNIDVPVKPMDTTGHVYLVKINESAMALKNNDNSNDSAVNNTIANSNSSIHVEGIDVTKGVNAAPVTNNVSKKTLALIIANEKYEVVSSVENATNDGLAFKEYCIRTFGIPKENIKYVSNLSYGRTKKVFKDFLELADMMNGEANLLIYYAGHGIPDNKTKDAYLMPVDADGSDTDVCVSLSSLYDDINSRNLNQCIVFLDACFSGAERGGDMILAARGVKLKPKEVVPQGKTIVFSATTGDQAAFSHKEEQHGLFTYYLLSKLQETKGKVKLGELADYLTEKVGFESRRINNIPQTPNVCVSKGLVDDWKNLRLTK